MGSHPTVELEWSTLPTAKVPSPTSTPTVELPTATIARGIAAARPEPPPVARPSVTARPATAPPVAPSGGSYSVVKKRASSQADVITCEILAAENGTFTVRILDHVVKLRERDAHQLVELLTLALK